MRKLVPAIRLVVNALMLLVLVVPVIPLTAWAEGQKTKIPAPGSILDAAIEWSTLNANGSPVAVPQVSVGPPAPEGSGSNVPGGAKIPTAVFTVCPEGPPNCDYTVIQDAVDAAADGDTIKVATGVYTGTHGRPAPPGYPDPPLSGVITQVVYISKSLAIYGGYTTSNGFADPPDPIANPTTLDAQGQGRVFAIAGEILYRGADGSVVDLVGLTGQKIRPYWRDIRLIFQDPYSSLNPRMTVFQIVSEALKVNKMGTQSEMKDRVAYLLKRVGLRSEYMQRYPHAFSGGERQRIGVARALVTNPRLIIADEAVSALDVSIRAQILNLMEELQRDFDLTYLFISHDLSVIRHICDRVVVMYVGKVVEVAEGLDLYVDPKHPYTEALMSAVPVSNPRDRNRGERIHLSGQVADPSDPPPGCYFHPRCRYAEEKCWQEEPPLRKLEGNRYVACHFAEGLALQGAAMPALED